MSAGNLPHQQTVEEHARQKHAREKKTLRAALAKVVADGTGMSGMGLAGGVNYQTVEAYCGVRGVERTSALTLVSVERINSLEGLSRAWRLASTQKRPQFLCYRSLFPSPRPVGGAGVG